MTENPFAPPASTSGVPWEELMGRLLVVEPTEHETGIQTTFGEKEAIRATVTVIDQDEPEAYENVLIFGLVMIGQLRPRLGQMVLGRLTQGAPKAGQKPPWRIEEATAQDQKLGGDWLRKRKATPFATAAAPGAGLRDVAPDAGAPPF